MLGTTFLLSTEALIAKTDAVLCGTSRCWRWRRSPASTPRRATARRPASARGWLFWIGLALATSTRAPFAPLVVACSIAVLSRLRGARWPGLARLNWIWGLILFAAIVGPWAWAVTVATDGGFWSAALSGDLAPKLAGGQETHGAPPGYHTVLAPLLMFPMTLVLPAAAVTAWTRRREPGVRFALAWLLPAWVLFEAMPTKLVHYPLPLYGAVAWLAAASLAEPQGAKGRPGSAGSALRWPRSSACCLAGGCFYLLKLYGDLSDLPEAILAAQPSCHAAAGLVGGFMLLRRAPAAAVASAAVGLGLVGHAALAAGLAPRLSPLWLSARTEQALEQAQLLPDQGIADAPVTVAGYAEPSLVFALGTPTETGRRGGRGRGPGDLREPPRRGRTTRVEAAFRRALAGYHAQARLVASVQGLDYSDGKKMTLRIFQSAAPKPTSAP